MLRKKVKLRQQTTNAPNGNLTNLGLITNARTLKKRSQVVENFSGLSHTAPRPEKVYTYSKTS